MNKAMETTIKQRMNRWLASIGVLRVHSVYVETGDDYDHMNRAAKAMRPYLREGVEVTTWNSDDVEYQVIHNSGAEFNKWEMELIGDSDRPLNYIDIPEAIILGLITRDEIPDGSIDADMEAILIDLLNDHRENISDPNWTPPDRTGE